MHNLHSLAPNVWAKHSPSVSNCQGLCCEGSRWILSITKSLVLSIVPLLVVDHRHVIVDDLLCRRWNAVAGVEQAVKDGKGR